MIAPADAWKPFDPRIDQAEQRARLRCLRAIVHLSCGPRGELLALELQRAETDPDALHRASVALERLAGLDRRHVLASYARLHRPA